MKRRLSPKIRLAFFLVIIVLIFSSFSGLERASGASTVNLYSKLGSESEITSPEIGPGGSLVGSPTFVSGKDGNGALLDEDGDYIQFPANGTIDANGDGYVDDEGMVSFWFKPQEDSSVSYKNIFNTNSKYAKVEVVHKYGRLFLHLRCDGSDINLERNPFSWSAGDWLHFRIWWNANDPTDNLKLWINGENIMPAHNGTFTWEYPYAEWFRLGSDKGIYDNIRVFDSLDGVPAIDSISDDTISPGEELTISGSGFGVNDDGLGQVNFGGVAGTIESWTDSSITATVPEGIADGQVTVTTYRGASNGVNYTITSSVSDSFYASSRDILLITGSKLGDIQGDSKVYADGTDLGTADYWDASHIYYQNISTKPGTVKVKIDGEELTASTSKLSLYSPYPHDSDINDNDLVSYWPFDSNWEDVKGDNDGTNRGTALRPESIFGKALQPSQILAFDDNRYVAFGGLLKLDNGDIIDVYRNSNTHGYASDSRLEMIRSVDGGHTWSEPETVLQIPGYDVGGGGVIIQLQNGDILCISHKRTVDREYFDPVVVASTDNGYTWSQRSTVTDNESGIITGGAYGYPIQLENGRILISCGTTNHPDNDGNPSRVIFYSDDNGYSWHYLGVILHERPLADVPSSTTTQAYSAGATEITVNDSSSFPDSGIMYITDGVNEEHFTYGYKDGNTLKNIYDNSLYVEAGINNDYNAGATVKFHPVKICETQIIKAPDDNNLYALIRHNGFDTSPGNRILYSRSTDQGATWTQAGVLHFNEQTSAPITGQGFRMYLSQENRLYLLYRWGGTQLAYSDDNGQTWTGDNESSTWETSIYKLNNNNGAYASFAEFGDKLLVQSYRGYGESAGGGTREHAYIEKAYIDKNSPPSLGNFVQIPATSSLQLNQFSIEFWLKIDDHYQNSSYGANQVILAKRDAREDLRDNCNYIFKLLDPTGADADKVEFGLRDSAHNYQSVKSNSALETGRWYYVAGTYNGQTMRLYLDGFLQDTLETDLTSLESSPLNIGIYSVHQDYGSSDRKFEGQIDNLKIWDRDIGSGAVLANANYSAPLISSISPNRADRGATITIKGSNFGDSQNDSSATIGGTLMTIKSWSDTSIKATIPLGISKGRKSVQVTVSGNKSNSKSFTVGRPPTISGIKVEDIQQTRVKIRWQTDELANSRIDYGQTSSLGEGSSSNSLKTGHSQILAGLLPGTKYYYRIYSTDSDGNTGYSNLKSFITKEAEGVSYYRWWSSLNDSTIKLEIIDFFDRQRSKRLLIKKGEKEYILYDQRPIFRGEAPPNAKLKIIIHSKELVGYTQADDYGKWQYQPEEPLEFGAHQIKVIVLTGQLKDYSKSQSFLIRNPKEIDQTKEESEGMDREEGKTAAKARSAFWPFLFLAIVIISGIFLAYRWYRSK